MLKYLFILIGCFGFAQTSLVYVSNGIEKLDINDPNITSLTEFSTFREERNDTITEYTKKPNRYVVNQYSNSSPMRVQKIFFLNGNIASENYRFYDVLINTTKKYDKKGNLIFVQNEEDISKRMISIPKLVEIIKDNYQVDLMNNNDSERSFNVRYYNVKIPFYGVTIRQRDTNVYKRIEVNAFDGSIIQEREFRGTK